MKRGLRALLELEAERKSIKKRLEEMEGANWRELQQRGHALLDQYGEVGHLLEPTRENQLWQVCNAACVISILVLLLEQYRQLRLW